MVQQLYLAILSLLCWTDFTLPTQLGMENEQPSPWYVALAAMTKRSKPVNEQDLPAPVRKLTEQEIAELNYTAPKHIQERNE
jgi:hypothetical protein